MRPRPAPSFLLFLGSALVGSTWSTNDATRQGKEIPPSVVGAIVDSPFQLRLGDSVDVVTLPGNPNGLQALNGVITGTPKQPMVMQAVRQRPGLPTADTMWIVAFAGALDEPYLPSVPYGYRGASLQIPSHLSRIALFGPRSSPEALALEANPTTDAGAALGRVLFYDRRLSANDGVSCASCHLQSAGFGDTARFSLGYRRQPTRRHSMALANVRFSAGGGFFWDQRAKTLEQQVLMPIQDGIEMGMSLENLQRKLQVIPYYPALYDAAFGSPEITIERTARALAQFLRTMVSADSPFDRAFQTTSAGGVVGLTPQQTEGQELFRSSGCSLCHSQATHAVVRAMNTGLDPTPADTGAGRGMFRAPSLRNVAIRAPYMHDGRFKSLDEVIDFYSSGVRANPDLDVRLRDRGTQGPRRFHLSDEQRAALLSFLHALTDSTFLTAPEFSDPFTRAKKGME